MSLNKNCFATHDQRKKKVQVKGENTIMMVYANAAITLLEKKDLKKFQALNGI